MIGLLLGGWDHPDGFEQAAVVEPVDPLEHGELDVVDVTPRTVSADDLGLEQSDDRLSKGVVVRVAHGPDRGGDAGLAEPFGVGDRDVLLGLG